VAHRTGGVDRFRLELACVVSVGDPDDHPVEEILPIGKPRFFERWSLDSGCFQLTEVPME
jgi:hypothetical protein